jgi:TPR repeat protein
MTKTCQLIKAILRDAFCEGNGIVEDNRLSTIYFHLSADQGDTFALCIYGHQLFLGAGIPSDKPHGPDYFQLSPQLYYLMNDVFLRFGGAHYS